MHTRHAVSLVAALAFVVLAFGSGDGGASSDTATVPSTVPAPTPAPAAADPEPEAAPPGGFPTTDDGHCCCDYVEADQEVQFFQPVDACQGMAGVCISELAPCEAAAKEVAEQAEKCCCEDSETILDDAADCTGTCHDFYVEGDAPGTCHW